MLLHRPNQHIFSLTGLGGIGKSSLVREYLAGRRGEYDAVLFHSDGGDIDALLADDWAVHVNTVERLNREPLEEYLPRKPKALRKLCAEQNLLIVLDNFSATWALPRPTKGPEIPWILLVSAAFKRSGFDLGARLKSCLAALGRGAKSVRLRLENFSDPP